MNGKKTIAFLLITALVFLIICPLLSIFAEAVFQNGRFSLSSAIATITENENAKMIGSSLLLGILVVIVSSAIALPLAYIFSRTSLARYHFFDIIFMIPFMTPPYIASMGWILFMQKRGLMQQLFPDLAFITDWFFSLAGLVLVMSFHVFPFMMTMMKNAMLSVPSSLDEAGAVLGGADEKELQALISYARRIGIAFQITDDILDLTGDERTMGKTLHKDEQQNKMTFVSLYGLDTARKIAEELTAAAREDIAFFGNRAQNLQNLAAYIVDRNH